MVHESTTRVAAREVAPAPAVLTPIGKRWAVIVGVSRYRAPGLELRYADRDAKEFRDLVVTPAGGNFAADNIRLLCDAEATTAAVTRAVRGFLLEAMPDDLVLLFFACHGGPDPRRPSGPLYLYTHDTDPRDVSGTAFAMDEIERSLQQLIRARRVVIIADTCHSAGIGGGVGTRGPSGAEATNQYLAAMAETKGGVALLTSAEAAEASLEDAKWGGGHGVFTHYLLEGMRGAADGFDGSGKDGIVSVGELFEYVREQVQRATDGRQHPCVGTTQYDRRLPMSVTGDLDVEQHLALGRRLVDVGWMLDDPAPMLLAARQFALAADLKRGLPSADAERGAALLAAGQPDQAVAALHGAVAAAPLADLSDDTLVHLGVAQAEVGAFADAAASLRRHRDAAGARDPWVDDYVDWLERPPGRTRALVIGAGTFPSGSQVTSLPGCANDALMVAEMLRTTFGLADRDITMCVAADATAKKVRARLRAVGRGARDDETLFVYFTGHSVESAGAGDPYLITHDRQSTDKLTGITPRELVDALDLPAREVVLVLDTHVSAALLDLVDELGNENLTVLLACGVGEVAYEKYIDGEPHGLFTALLVDALSEVGRDTTYEAVIGRVRARLADDPTNPGQTPQLAGAAAGRVFGGRFALAGLWRARRRWAPRESDRTMLRQATERFDLPIDWWANGRLAMSQGFPRSAEECFAKAATGPERRFVLADMALANIAAADRDAALATLGELAHEPDRGLAEAATEATAALAPPPPSPAVAVVAPMSGSSVGGRDYVAGLVGLLAGSLGRDPTSIETLVGTEATIQAMTAAVSRLGAGAAATGLLVFVGAVDVVEGMAYRLGDGVLSAAEVRATGGAKVVGLLRIVHGLQRDAAEPPSAAVLGDVGLAAAVVVEAAESLQTLAERAGEVWAQRSTLGGWIDAVPGAAVIPDQPQLTVADLAAWPVARGAIERARRGAAFEAARLANDAVARREAHHDEHPEGHLQAGLAQAAALQGGAARRELQTARNLYDDPAINADQRAADPGMERWHLEARYHLGRLLYLDGGDLYDAVATLEAAARTAPDDARVLFHLVAAIRALVDRESLVEARRRARRYLELGAPLGGAAALRDFVAPPTR